MAAIISMLLLLTFNLAFGAETGVKLAVTNIGLQYANRVGGPMLREKLQTMTIPDQSGREGSKTYRLTNIRVNGISGLDTRLSLNPWANGVTLDIYNFGINLQLDWNLQYTILWRHSSDGSADLRLSRTSVTVVARLGERGGRPYVAVQSCNCRIDDFGVDLHGGFAAWIINTFFKGTVRDKLRNILQDKMCDIVNTQIITGANEKLGKMKVSMEIARRFILDYSLTRTPTVTINYIEIASRGEVYWKDNRQASPFTAAALPAFNEFNRMVYLYISEYSANTFCYVAHVNGFLKYNMTVDKLPAGGLDLLNTTGQLHAQYAESTVELRISSWSAPSVKFNNQKLTIAAVANVRVVVNTESGEVTPLELRVSASVTIQPSIADGKLTASVSSCTLNTTVIRSDIGEIDEQGFNTIISQATNTVIIPKLNDFGRQGIDLPVTGMFRLYNTWLNSQTGYLQLASDVVYQA